MATKLHPNYCFFLYFAMATICQSCQKDGTISLDNANDKIGAEISDSTSIMASTYQLEKIPTNGKGVMLVGNLHDPETGDIKLSSYFRVSNSDINSVSIPDGAVFDSLSLVLPYQGYYYGDTTLTQQVSLYRLQESITLIEQGGAWEDDEVPVFVNGSALYSNNKFAYDPSPMGTVSFRPRPASTIDTVFIKMEDNFGKELWQKVKNKDFQVTNSDEFLDYFKGMVLVPVGGAGAATGFKSDAVSMNLHYSYIRDTDGKRVQDTVKMQAADSTYQFNRVEVDRKNSTLKELASLTKGEVVSSLTAQKVMLQGLTGLVAKISFPYLWAFVNRDDVVINKATLSVQSTQQSSIPFLAPSSLNMFLADQYGTPQSLLTYSWETTVQAPQLQASTDGGAQLNAYTFDLTEYVSSYRKAPEGHQDALYLSLPVADLLNKVDRLVVAPGDQAPLIKLRLWYTRY